MGRSWPREIYHLVQGPDLSELHLATKGRLAASLAGPGSCTPSRFFFFFFAHRSPLHLPFTFFLTFGCTASVSFLFFWAKGRGNIWNGPSE